MLLSTKAKIPPGEEESARYESDEVQNPEADKNQPADVIDLQDEKNHQHHADDQEICSADDIYLAKLGHPAKNRLAPYEHWSAHH